MIITFWMYAYCLLDTPEYRLRLEARRIADALQNYNTSMQKYIYNQYTDDKSRQ